MFQITDQFPLLPLLLKVIPKIVQEQTVKSLNDNIFYKYQSSFRGNYSTDIFQSFLNDNILRSFGNELYCGMILTDLQKGT